ncbi:MAG: DUF2069 domain-containing protein [Burkholderiales bacterium]
MAIRAATPSRAIFYLAQGRAPAVISKSLLSIATALSLTGLISVCLAWELWLAPIRPGGSFLALKALPLLIPIFGVVRGHRYTYQWTCMLVLAYFAEGCVRAYAELGISRGLAVAEIVLSTLSFCLAILFAKHSPAKEKGTLKSAG